MSSIQLGTCPPASLLEPCWQGIAKTSTNMKYTIFHFMYTFHVLVMAALDCRAVVESEKKTERHRQVWTSISADTGRMMLQKHIFSRGLFSFFMASVKLPLPLENNPRVISKSRTCFLQFIVQRITPTHPP